MSDFKAHMRDPAQVQQAGRSLMKSLLLVALALAAGVCVLAWALLRG